MTPVERLIAQAVEQGHPRVVVDVATLATVATIIGTVRQGVTRDRHAA